MTHRYGFNWNHAIIGASGTGKSWLALLIAWLLDPHFTKEKICFTQKEFLEAIKNIKHNGEVIILDETGIVLSSRDWMRDTNKMLNQTIQTFRYKHPITLLITPHLGFMDKQVREMLNMYFEVRRNEDKPPEALVYEIKPNRRDGEKIYYPHPIITKNGVGVRLGKLIIDRKPPKELVDEYEEKQKNYKNELLRQNYERAELMERQLWDKHTTINDIIKEVVADQDSFKNARDKLDWRIIANHFKVSRDQAQTILTLTEKHTHTTS